MYLFKIIVCFQLIAVTVSSADWFTEVTDELNLAATPSSRIAAVDLNDNDYPDLFLHGDVNLGGWDVRNRMRVFLNMPVDSFDDVTNNYRHTNRIFTDFTLESGVTANRRSDDSGRHGSFALFGDVNNNGYVDYFSGAYYHRHTFLPGCTDYLDWNDLFLNDGTGRFYLAPDTVFHDAGPTNATSAVFADIDRNGCLDLFVCNWFVKYYADGINDVFSSELLYKGNGDGTFFDISGYAGLTTPEMRQPSYGATAADVNNDGYPDLFASNYCRGPSKHFRNNGDGTFDEIQLVSNFGQYVGRGHGIWQRTCSWGAIPRDFNNNGHIDLFTILTHGDHEIFSTVLVNDGTGVFEWNFDFFRERLDDDPDPWHHGDHCAVWIDIDNNGLTDLVVSESGYNNNRLYVFKQQADHTFTLATAESGLAIVNEQNMPVNSLVVADINLNGSDDLILGGGGEWPVRAFKNTAGSANNHIAVTLVGAGGPGFSNGSAIGARVEVTTGDRTVTRVVHAGDGHFVPQGPFRMNIGLGQHSQVDTLKIIWPNFRRDTYIFNSLPVNRHYRFFENPKPESDGVILTAPPDRYRQRDGYVIQGYFYPADHDVPGQYVIPVFLEYAGGQWLMTQKTVTLQEQSGLPGPPVLCFQKHIPELTNEYFAWTDSIYWHGSAFFKDSLPDSQTND